MVVSETEVREGRGQGPPNLFPSTPTGRKIELTVVVATLPSYTTRSSENRRPVYV